MKSNINKRDTGIASVFLIAGLFIGWLFFHSPGAVNEAHNHKEHEEAGETIYTCSMHPQIRQNEPGLCPICAMDLVPVITLLSEGDDVDPDEIQMSEAALALASVQTTIVKRSKPERTVQLFGKVKADERNISELTSRFGGRIEKLYINYTGQNVDQGQKLGTIYSPELVTAQQELLEAIKFKETNPGFYKSARTKLKLWDLTTEQIISIEKKGEPRIYFEVLSPISGTVTKRHVVLGDYVKEGSALFEVINLDKVWVMFEAYESDLPWIRTGDKIDFSIQSVPGKSYSGKVSYIDPFIDARTRVAYVRVELNNPGLVLKPGMFANGVLVSQIAKNSNEILIPKSAILWTGKRAVVYVKVPKRETVSFLYREVVLGPEAGDFYIVNEGLHEGETIAVNGVFKIDASAQLAGKSSMMNPGGGKVSTGHNHGDMENLNMQEHEANLNKPYDVKKEFKVQFTGFYMDYLNLTEAFVSSESGNVQRALKTLSNKLGQIDKSLLTDETHLKWMDYSKDLKSYLKSINEYSDIEKQRAEFVQFNLILYKSIKAFGLDEVTTYYQYCPMANDNQGAYWFGDSKEIRNPYFGDKMLLCGEVKETIY